MQLIVFLCAACFLTAAPRSHDQVLDERPKLTIAVGDKVVRGGRLKPFDNFWSLANRNDDALVQETTRLAKVKGRKCYIRDQYFPMQGEVKMHTELVLDAKTLETVSMQKEVLGLPEGATLGGRPHFVRWEFDGLDYITTTRSSGEPVVAQGHLEEPMFNGGGLGLVLAALPLKKGFEARFPIAMSLGLSTKLTQYWVHVYVVGREPFPRAKGKDVMAWIVDVDWINRGSDVVSSPGGYDQSGGAYYVLPKPPKGFPHVPRYANNSTLIELELK